MICRVKKTDIIVAIVVLLFFGGGFLFGIYKIGEQNGIKSQQNEILVLRQLNTTHLQKIDSLEIEIEKGERYKHYPQEQKKEILQKKWIREELPKHQQSCKEWKQKNPNAPIKMGTPCSMLDMLKNEQEYVKQNLGEN